MKLTQKRSKKTLIIVLVAAIVVCSGLAYYVFAMNGGLFGWKFRQDVTSDNINLNPPTKEQSDTGKTIKENATNQNEDKPGTTPDTPETPPEGQLAVSFTSVAQVDGVLRIRSQISPLISSGDCTLSLTKDSTTVTKSAGVYASASVSTCQGFDVPTSELSAGMWSVTLNVKSGDRSGQSATSTEIK
jgi:hypothetical protein